jgi:hypothetical protein
MTVAVGHRLTALAAAPGLSRRTIRMRLTLIYGGLFLLCGARLLAITYVLVSNATAGYFSSTGPNGYTVGGFAGGPHGAKPRGGPAAGLQNSGCRGPSRSAPGQAQAVAALRRRQRRMQAVIASRPGERFASAGGQGWTDMRPSGPVRPGPARRTEARPQFCCRGSGRCWARCSAWPDHRMRQARSIRPELNVGRGSHGVFFGRRSVRLLTRLVVLTRSRDRHAATGRWRARHSASARPIGVDADARTNGQISSEMARQLAVADSSPRMANKPRLMRCRIT